MPDTREHTIIGVVPAWERSARARLLDAFERAYPVRFEGRDLDQLRGIDAVVFFPAAGSQPAPAHLASLRYQGEERQGGVVEDVQLADHPMLTRPLRRARLTEAYAAGASLSEDETGEVLATVGGRPAWRGKVMGGVAHREVSIAPSELGERDALRSRLTPARSLAVLSLAEFVQHAAVGLVWQTPGIRAAYVIDDPNLRRPTYGYIDYADMAASARQHRYHVSIAMVPLDGWPISARTVGLFKREQRYLSLCIHGNDHVPNELQRPRSIGESVIPAAQAIRRTANFERRTGLSVDRVMVPPHESLGAAGAQGLLACGFEAFSGTRPYLWLGYAHDLGWLSRPADAGPLVGWGSAEIADGLPALLRLDFNQPREELVFRAFLGQPLIMYGHDDLLRDGPGELERAAAEIWRLGDVHWQGLGAIARSSYLTRRRGSTLEVRMLGRRISVDVPDGVSDMLVDVHAVRESPTRRVKVTGGTLSEVDFGDARLRLTVKRAGPVEMALDYALDPHMVPPPLPNLRATARRFVAEGRDRTRAKLSKALR